MFGGKGKGRSFPGSRGLSKAPFHCLWDELVVVIIIIIIIVTITIIISLSFLSSYEVKGKVGVSQEAGV